MPRPCCSCGTARRRPPARCCPAGPPGSTSPTRGGRRPSIAAERIAELKRVDAIYSSPLERAKETAAPIAKTRGLRTKIDRGLLECDFGEWTGAELKKLMKLPEWGTVQRAPSTFRFPGGESFTEMQTRMVSTLDRLRAAHPGGTIVCVSHADPIKAAVAHALGTHIDLFQRIVISPVLGHRDRAGVRRAGRAHRELDRPIAHRPAAELTTMAVFYEFDDVDAFTIGTDRPAG